MDTSVEFKVNVGSELVAQYGKEKIEKFIQDYLNLAVLRLGKTELLDDLKDIDINEKQWNDTRDQAWSEYGRKFLFRVSA